MTDKMALLNELESRGLGNHPAVVELKRRFDDRGTAPESRVSAAEWSEDGTRAFRTGKSGTVYDANYLMDQSPGADQRRVEEYGPVAGRLANIGAGFDRATTMERNASRREQMRDDYGFAGGVGASALDLVDLASGAADTASLEASGAVLNALGAEEAADRRREMTEQQLTGGGVNTAAQVASMLAPVGATAQGVKRTAQAVGSPVLAGNSVASQLARGVGSGVATYNVGVGNTVDYDAGEMRYIDNTDIGALGPLIGLPEAETGVTMGMVPYIAGAAPVAPRAASSAARAVAQTAPPLTDAAARQRALRIAREKGLSPDRVRELEGAGAGEMLPMDLAPETAGAAARQMGQDGKIREAARARETGRGERLFNTTSDALGADAELLPENQRLTARTKEGEAARTDPVRYDRATEQFQRYTDDVTEAKGAAREEGYKFLPEAKLPEQDFDLTRPETSTTLRATEELNRLAEKYGVSGGARRSEDVRGVRFLENGNRAIEAPYQMPDGRRIDPIDQMPDETIGSLLGERGIDRAAMDIDAQRAALKKARSEEARPSRRTEEDARELKNAQSIWSSAERAALRSELKGKDKAQKAASDLAEAASERADSIEQRTYTQDDAAIFNPLRVQQVKIEAQSKSDAAATSGDSSAKSAYGRIAGMARDLLHRFETADGTRPALIGDRYFSAFEGALSRTETKDGVKLKGAYAQGQKALKQGEQPEAIRTKLANIARRIEASDKLPEGGTMKGVTRDRARAAALEELHAYRMGALRGYLDYIQNQTQEGAKLVNPANTQVQAKLAALFDDPKQLKDYLRYLSDERRMQATEREVLYGSQTASRLEEGHQLEEAAGGRRFDVLNSLRNGLSAVVADLLRPQVQRLSTAFVDGVTARVAKQLDQIMTAHDLEKLARELEAARAEQRAPNVERRILVTLNALATRAIAQQEEQERAVNSE